MKSGVTQCEVYVHDMYVMYVCTCMLANVPTCACVYL